MKLKWRDLLYSLRVRRILPAADVLVTNTFWLPLLVRRKTRGLLYVHVQRAPKGQMRLYAHAARLLAVSHSIADQIVRQAPQLRPKVRVIPNALPFDVPAEKPWRNRHRTILFVGRLHPEKGIELLLRAISQLHADLLAGWQIKLVGSHEADLGGGGERWVRTMKKLASTSGAQIEWTGPIFDPAKLLNEYAAAQLFVYPSIAERGEALPVAPLEAMANGCIPIVSALACFQDYVENDVTGAVFDHQSAAPESNLARCLANLLRSDEERLARMSAAARAKAAEFAAAPVAEQYLQDFESLLGEHRPSIVAESIA